jgi:hypothetical protein
MPPEGVLAEIANKMALDAALGGDHAKRRPPDGGELAPSLARSNGATKTAASMLRNNRQREYSVLANTQDSSDG